MLSLPISKKGNASVWFVVLTGCFVVALFWIIWSNVLYVHVAPPMLEDLNAIPDNATWINKTDVLNTWNIIDMVFQYFPLMLIFGLILWGFVSVQRRQPDEYGYVYS